MSIFKARSRRSAQQIHLEHGHRERALRHRAATELRDPMTTVVIRVMS